MFEYPHGQHYSFLHFECPRDFELSSTESGAARPGKRILSSTNVLYVYYECTSSSRNLNSHDCPGGGFVANISHIMNIEEGKFIEPLITYCHGVLRSVRCITTDYVSHFRCDCRGRFFKTVQKLPRCPRSSRPVTFAYPVPLRCLTFIPF